MHLKSEDISLTFTEVAFNWFWVGIVICIFNTTHSAQCPPNTNPNLFPNPSFEDMDCCPDDQGLLDACIVGWYDPINITPDYYHKCDFYGWPLVSRPPLHLVDGEGCIGLLQQASGGEHAMTCLSVGLNPMEEYVFSAYAGFRMDNTPWPPHNPYILSLYGSMGSCTSPLYPSGGCPPAPVWELLAEITYNFVGDEGWVFGQSVCFQPSQPHTRLVLTGSCSLSVLGYNYIDLVDLRLCEELLEVNVEVEPECGFNSNGSIDLSVSGGMGPYTYDWDIDGVGDNDDQEDLIGISGGSYQIIVIDANGLSRCLNILVPRLIVEQPIFDAIAPMCVGAPIVILPPMSQNEPPISGAWDSDTVFTNTPGHFTYVFTPDTTVCADTVHQHVTIRRQSTNPSMVTYQGCQGDGYQQIINHTLYHEGHPSGQEVIDLPDVCDSTIQIHFTYHPPTSAVYTDTACAGSGHSIMINSNIYNESNPSGQEIVPNANNCDSTIDINLIFLPNGAYFLTEQHCAGSGERYVINGTIYDEFHPMGSEVFSAENGCDSTVYINLDYITISPTHVNYTGCIRDGYSVEINGVTYDESNPTGNETLQSVSGCDSNIVIELVFNDVINRSETYSGCIGDGYSININGTIYDESNPLGTDTIASMSDCDTIVNVDLEFNSEITRTETHNGCIGDGYSVTVNNVLYDESNPTGTERLMSSGGCDSVITIDLVFNSEINTSENYSGCVGDGYSVTVNNVVYNESNPTGIETLVSSDGCDSVVTIDLVFNSELNTTETYSGCMGDGYSITVNNVVYDELNPSGTETLVSSGGCDSVVTINLEFNSEINTSENYSGCVGDGYSVVVNGNTYDESNPSGTETLVSSGGCDSVITINLVFNSEINTSETYSGCIGDGYSVTVNNVVYDESNPTGTETLVSTGGCDSVIAINLEFNSEINTSENYSGCIGDGYSVVVNGNTYDESNPTGIETLVSSGGCDSVITIDLEFNSEIYTSENYSGCIGDGYSVEVNGVVYDENNPVGEERMISVSGCDSVVSIHLEYLEALYGDIIYHGCEGDDYQIEVNGTIYDAGHPTGEELLVSVSGCDSVVRVDLVFEPVREFTRTFTTITGEPLVLDISDEIAAPDSIVAIDWLPMTDLSCTDCPVPEFSGTTTTDYTVEVTDISGCVHRGYIRVEVGDNTSASSVFVPDIFSPNDDGINDVFLPYTASNSVAEISLFEIYDRWGKRVFQRRDLPFDSSEVGWDGTIDGKEASPGIYVYVLRFVEASKEKSMFGQINLVK